MASYEEQLDQQIILLKKELEKSGQYLIESDAFDAIEPRDLFDIDGVIENLSQEHLLSDYSVEQQKKVMNEVKEFVDKHFKEGQGYSSEEHPYGYSCTLEHMRETNEQVWFVFIDNTDANYLSAAVSKKSGETTFKYQGLYRDLGEPTFSSSLVVKNLEQNALVSKENIKKYKEEKEIDSPTKDQFQVNIFEVDTGNYVLRFSEITNSNDLNDTEAYAKNGLEKVIIGSAWQPHIKLCDVHDFATKDEAKKYVQEEHGLKEKMNDYEVSQLKESKNEAHEATP